MLPYNPSTAFSRALGASQLIKPGLATGKVMITSMSFMNLSSSPAFVTIRNGNTGDPNWRMAEP